MAQKLRRCIHRRKLDICAVINAVGVWFFSIKTNRYLYLLRNDGKNPHTWGLPGGKSETNETLFETIHRECSEELGSYPDPIKLIPIEQFTSLDQKFTYHTFFCLVEDELDQPLEAEQESDTKSTVLNDLQSRVADLFGPLLKISFDRLFWIHSASFAKQPSKA